MNKETKGSPITLPKDTLLSCTASRDPEKPRQRNVSIEIDIAQASMGEKRRPLSSVCMVMCFNDSSDRSEWLIPAIHTPLDGLPQCGPRGFQVLQKDAHHFPARLEQGTQHQIRAPCLAWIHQTDRYHTNVGIERKQFCSKNFCIQMFFNLFTFASAVSPCNSNAFWPPFEH